MRRVAAAALALVGLGAVASAPSAALVQSPLPLVGANVSAPDHDPFYQVPKHLRRLANGAVLDARPVTAYAAGLAVAAHAWQVLYKTLDANGAPTATVATILVPSTPWTGAGRRPLVSYDLAEDGVGLRCAPSYALRAGLSAGLTVSAAEAAYGIPQLIAHNWAVVVPDYEGPRSLFSSAPMAAHGILDGIRAARRFRPAGVGGSTPIAMWGYSGGGFATTAAAMAQAAYAPELHIRALAIGGVPGDQRAVFNAAAGSAAGGATLLMLIGQTRANPAAHLMSTVDSVGQAAAGASRQDCLADAVLRAPLFDLREHMSAAGMQQFLELQRINSPLFLAGRPQVPVFDYHTLADELVPYGTANALMREFCSEGVQLTMAIDPVGDHVTEEVAGGIKAINYLADRFAGKPVATTCGNDGLLPPLGVGPV